MCLAAGLVFLQHQPLQSSCLCQPRLEAGAAAADGRLTKITEEVTALRRPSCEAPSCFMTQQQHCSQLRLKAGAGAVSGLADVPEEMPATAFLGSP